MKEPYGEGVATHTGPESCVVGRKAGGEALTGVHAGRLMSREIYDLAQAGCPGCRRSELKRKAISNVPILQGTLGPRAVEEPEHAWKHFAREPGDPTVRLPVEGR
jgi:hypothetical protein